MPTLLLVRHAQGSFGTANYDVLSEAGHEQAAALRDELVRREARIDRVICGGLERQYDTAAPIADAYGLEVERDPRWDEYSSEAILAHYGHTEARLERAVGGPESTPTISSREFQALLDVALHAWIDEPGGGPPEHGYGPFSTGVLEALNAVTGTLQSGETGLVVSSGGPIAIVCTALMGLPPASFVTFNRVTVNSSVSKIVHGRGGTTLVSFNEHGHLESGGRSLVTYR